MSQFYDQASLVVVPSGYKAGTVYAQKPLTTDGQLAFTRTGDTATRVNSAGIIEKVRTNLLTYSQDVTNAAWTKSATNASANTTTAPDGTTTADTITETATSAQHAFFNSFTTGASIATFSVYLKANGRNFATIYPQGTSMAGYATVDLSNGTINTTGGSTFLRAAIESAGNGWYRIQVALTTTANSLACVVYLSNTLGGISPTYLGDGTSGVFVWGAQLETGDVATAYIPTTTAAVSVGPVANVPRLDYLGSTCPRLLLEPQRTNLCVQSENLDNAVWNKVNATVTANNTIAPDGFLGADRINEDTANGAHAVERATSSAAGTYTFSIFIKKGTRRYAGMRAVVNGYTNRYFSLLDLDTGLIVNNNTIGTGVTWTSSVENYGNGWYRLIITGNHTSSNITLLAALSDSANPTYLGGAPMYTGSTSENGFFWGAQIELGSYATSYIPTLAASATRGADACSKTGISSLIGQTEGTIFLEVDAKVFSQMPISSEHRVTMVSDNTNNNRILLDFIVTSGGVRRIGVNVISGNVSQANLIFNTSVDKVYKIATAYNTNDFTLFVDGVERATDTSGVTFSGTTLSRLDVGQDRSGTLQQSNPIAQAILFPTRLTNAQLAELTTL